MKFEKTINIPSSIARYVEAACSDDEENRRYWLGGKESSYLLTVKFENGVVVDFKLCGSDEAPSWCEGVMFVPNEKGTLTEVSCTEPEDTILGEWDFWLGADWYHIYVRKEEINY